MTSRDDQIERKSLYYDDKRLAYFNSLANELLERFSPKVILDVGCGSGQLVFCFRNSNLEAFGLDAFSEFLEIAPASIKEYLSCVDVDKDDFPFPDDFFDMIVSHHSIEHFHKPKRFILHAKRILKKNGIIVIETTTPPFEMGQNLLRILHIQKASKEVHPSTHSVRYWKKNFKKEGFQIEGNLKDFVRRTCIDLDPPNWWVGQKLVHIGFIGKAIWRWMAPHVRGSLILRKTQER